MTFYLLINLFVFLIFTIWLYRRTKHEPLTPFFIYALFFKVGAGLMLGVIYFNYFKSGDTISYHLAAEMLSDLARETPDLYFRYLIFSDPIPEGFTYFLNQPRALLIVKITSIFEIITGNNYWLICSYFSLFSFMGTWLLANRISSLFPTFRFAALVSFLFFPTIVFWSSGLLKESLAMGCIGLYMYIFLLFFRKLRINIIQLAVMLIAAILLWSIKYYYAGVLFSVTLAIVLTKIVISDPRFSFVKKKPVLRIYAIILVILGIGVTFLHPNLSPGTIMNVLTENHNRMLFLSDPDSMIRFINIGEGSTYFMVNLPISLAGGLFLPLPWNSNGFFILITGFFNLLILVLALSRIIDIKLHMDNDQKLLFTGACTYILVLAVLLAFSSPNFGTLERFKISYLPFFLLIIIQGNKFIVKMMQITPFSQILNRR